MITTYEQFNKRVQIDASVSVSGLTVVVRGSGKFRDREFTIEETQHVAAGGPEKSWINGYVVRVKATDAIEIFVDEFTKAVKPYSFLESPFELIYPLFDLEVEANATEITNGVVRRAVARAPEQTEGGPTA
jgi:hypothetical protein